MNFIIVKPQLSKEELIELIIKEFPPTKEDILDEIYEGLIHLQVGVLADYTNQCIQKSRFDEVSRIFQFFDAVILVGALQYLYEPNDCFREVKRVLKPGGFAFVMSAPRSDVHSRMCLMLEEAGFRIDFTPIAWTYATGFPKAMNIGKAVDKLTK